VHRNELYDRVIDVMKICGLAPNTMPASRISSPAASVSGSVLPGR
jgi:hypothetical protein